MGGGSTKSVSPVHLVDGYSWVLRRGGKRKLFSVVTGKRNMSKVSPGLGWYQHGTPWWLGGADCSRPNPWARGGHLTIPPSQLTAWLLVKCLCPVNLAGGHGYSPGLWWEQLINCKIWKAVVENDIVVMLSNSHRWSTVRYPGGDQFILSYFHEIGVWQQWGRWITSQLTLAGSGKLRVWERWSWCVFADCWGCIVIFS